MGMETADRQAPGRLDGSCGGPEGRDEGPRGSMDRQGLGPVDKRHEAAGPWRRMLARHVDYLLVTPVFLATLEAFAGEPPGLEQFSGSPLFVLLAAAVLDWACVSGTVLPEALMLRAWGTSPGKWLLGLRLIRCDGERPTFTEALDRSLGVAVWGMGLGLPVLAPLAQLRAWRVWVDRGEVEWDAERTRVVRAGRRGTGSAAMALLAVLSVVAWVGLLLEDDPAAGRFAEQAEGRLADLRASLAVASRAEGGSVVPASGVFHGSLRSGEEETLDIRVGPAAVALVLAACDDDCTDLDLEVIEGTEILGADRAEDATPLVAVPADEARWVEARVVMATCAIEPCAYALQVLASSGGGIPLSRGTCFAAGPDGRVLTAHHVVAMGGVPVVRFEDGPPLEARVERASPANDLALLRVPEATPNWLPLADTEPRLGEPVLTVGHPADQILGRGPKFGEGVVGGLTGLFGEHNAIQVSVPAHPGSSGSPVVDRRGRVIGVLVGGADPEAFEAEVGAPPDGVRWAVRAAYARPLVGEVPDLLPAASREEAIERTRRAVCEVSIGSGDLPESARRSR